MEKQHHTSQAEFTVSRTFDAPREKIWKAFTDAKHLDKWWGPKGFTMKTAKLDFTPGGMFHYSMTSPDGNKMWGKFVYREIEEPGRIVFINSFSDAEGATTGNPWLPVWPLEILNVMTLIEENGKTTVTLRGGPINASDAEVECFSTQFKGMEQGFNGTFDQLEEHLRNF